MEISLKHPETRPSQVLQLQLTLSRAIGDSCGSVGGILQVPFGACELLLVE